MFQLLKPFLWKYCQLGLISFADRESKWNIKFSILGCQIIVYLIFQRRDVTMGMGSHVLPSIIAITTAWAVSSLLYWAVFNISAFLAMDAFHTFLLQTQQICQEKLFNTDFKIVRIFCQPSYFQNITNYVELIVKRSNVDQVYMNAVIRMKDALLL